MASPITFIHQGNTRYLKYAVAQANASGYETIVVGDASVARDVDAGRLKCQFFLLSDLWGRATEFAGVYNHLSVNQEQYELFCFQRWYVIYELIEK